MLVISNRMFDVSQALLHGIWWLEKKFYMRVSGRKSFHCGCLLRREVGK